MGKGGPTFPTFAKSWHFNNPYIRHTVSLPFNFDFNNNCIILFQSSTVLTRNDVSAVYNTDYTSPSNSDTETLTFGAGDTSRTVTYGISSDTEFEDIESFTLTLSLSAATATFAAVVSPSMSTIYIMDCTGTLQIPTCMQDVKKKKWKNCRQRKMSIENFPLA